MRWGKKAYNNNKILLDLLLLQLFFNQNLSFVRNIRVLSKRKWHLFLSYFFFLEFRTVLQLTNCKIFIELTWISTTVKICSIVYRSTWRLWIRKNVVRHLKRWRGFNISFPVPLMFFMSLIHMRHFSQFVNRKFKPRVFQFTEQGKRTVSNYMYLGFTKMVMIWFPKK